MSNSVLLSRGECDRRTSSGTRVEPSLSFFGWRETTTRRLDCGSDLPTQHVVRSTPIPRLKQPQSVAITSLVTCATPCWTCVLQLRFDMQIGAPLILVMVPRVFIQMQCGNPRL